MNGTPVASARSNLAIDGIAGEVTRLREAALNCRNDIVTGPGGQRILLEDSSGNPVELAQPAGK